MLLRPFLQRPVHRARMKKHIEKSDPVAHQTPSFPVTTISTPKFRKARSPTVVSMSSILNLKGVHSRSVKGRIFQSCPWPKMRNGLQRQLARSRSLEEKREPQWGYASTIAVVVLSW